jgi:hypothetical protein
VAARSCCEPARTPVDVGGVAAADPPVAPELSGAVEHAANNETAASKLKA